MAIAEASVNCSTFACLFPTVATFSSSAYRLHFETVASPVENPPAEVTPDFAHEPCKGYREEAIGEIH